MGSIIKNKRALTTSLLGACVSGFFVWLIFRKADWEATIEPILKLQFRELVIPILITLTALLLRPLRWRYLFTTGGRPSFSRAFCVLSVGNMTNNLLPARGGDLLRCALISEYRSLGNSTVAFGTLTVEKVLDGLALVCLLFASFIYLNPPSWVMRIGVLALLIFLLAFAFLFALRKHPEHVSRLTLRLLELSRMGALTPRANSAIRRFTEGLSSIASVRTLVFLFAFTLVIWLLDAALVYSLGRSVAVDVPILGALVVSAIIALSSMIPAGPSGIGTYEYFSIAALKLIGVRPEIALTVTVLLHAWAILFTLSVGLLSMFAINLKLSSIASGQTLDSE